MFDWLLTNRRSPEKHVVELLSAAIAELEESHQLNRQALAVCEKWARIVDSQGAQLAEAQAENRRLWAALSAPKELQQYMAAGCSEAQAKELALGRRFTT